MIIALWLITELISPAQISDTVRSLSLGQEDDIQCSSRRRFQSSVKISFLIQSCVEIVIYLQSLQGLRKHSQKCVFHFPCPPTGPSIHDDATHASSQSISYVRRSRVPPTLYLRLVSFFHGSSDVCVRWRQTDITTCVCLIGPVTQLNLPQTEHLSGQRKDFTPPRPNRGAHMPPLRLHCLSCVRLCLWV